MTGFGEARHAGDDPAVSVEVRTVNNRHLKLTVRGTDPYPMMEGDLEKVVKRHVRRGTVTVNVRCVRRGREQEYVLNEAALAGYIRQVRSACEQAGQDPAPVLAQVLGLPGVAGDAPAPSGRPSDTEFAAVTETLDAALVKLQAMRRQEGQAMAEELMSLWRHVGDELSQIRLRLPQVVEMFRERLRERVANALAAVDVSLRPEDLSRDVAVFAERADVSEEVMRLGCHLEEFERIVRTEEDGPGRKLDFVLQEMNRETNTIGSKAGDVAVSRHVVEIKATLEKARELVQNVE